MKHYHSYILATLIIVNLLSLELAAQDSAPGAGMSTPLSGNAMAASHFENTPVNYYTGIPSISIPLFNYADQNGLSLGVTLDYSAGGIGVNQSPSTAGLGWSVNTGGCIVRTVRGMPDDYPVRGFLYSSALPADFRALGSKYYHDSLDAEQDIFQYNINGRSGKFFIGKNKEIITIPLSKLRIEYDTLISSINSFRITTEEGVKYFFNVIEAGSTIHYSFKCGFDSIEYNTAWYLTNMVAAFSKDTIKFSYIGSTDTKTIGFGSTAYVSPNGSIFKYITSTGRQSVIIKKISKIFFPDKKVVSFIYDPFMKYDENDFCLNNLQISDSVFRYSYQFEWDTANRSFLKGVRSYTNKYIKPCYRFIYNTPCFPAFNTPADTLSNKRDHWGYYNATAYDTNRIPAVENVFEGANREPTIAALAGSLSTIIDPTGGKTFYTFENNDIYRPFEVVPQYKNINCRYTSATNITTSHVTNNKDSFTLSFATFSRLGAILFVETPHLICSITNADSTIIYATDSISLFDLYTYGTASVVFNNIPAGNHVFRTRYPADATAPGANLFVGLNWNNQVPIKNIYYKLTVGGIRIKQIAHFDPITGKTDTISTFRYILPNGRSTGFLGTFPIYHHAYYESYDDGDNVTNRNLISISSESVNNVSYTQGSPVGYSKVEVIKGSLYNNIGKEVYEYSTAEDAGVALQPEIFPYVSSIQRDWAMGLCKKMSVYDKAGAIRQQTVNTYNTISKKYTDSSFRSLKLGLSAMLYDRTTSPTTSKEVFTGEYYFPETGRSDLVSTTQTFYHSDNSTQVKTQQLEYDSNFNTVKMISGYDLNRGLSMERRMYYPYNYTLSGVVRTLKDSSIYTVVSTEDWITGDSIPRLISASATDFQQLPSGLIKPRSIYALQIKSPVPLSVIGSFDPSSLIRNASFIKKQQEFVSYDSTGNCLEMRDIRSGISNTVIMDYQKRLAIAKVSNAKLSDVAYSSFEADGSGNWMIPSTNRNDSNAITGKKSYDLSNGAITKSGLDNNTTYVVTYWKKDAATVSVSGAANVVLTAEQRGWKFYTQTISSAASLTVSGSGLIDELRLYPKDANMATTTYEPLIGITGSCDPNNSITYYNYDSANRMNVVRDKDMHVLKKYEYADNLINRDLTTPLKINKSGYLLNPATGIYESKCLYYWLYEDNIMSEGYEDSISTHCAASPRPGLRMH